MKNEEEKKNVVLRNGAMLTLHNLYLCLFIFYVFFLLKSTGSVQIAVYSEIT
jgi:hypothetical protein